MALLEGARVDRAWPRRPKPHRFSRVSRAEVSFYGMLSAEAIGQRQEIASTPLEPDAQALAAFGAIARRAPGGEARAARHAAGIAAGVALRRARATRRYAAPGGELCAQRRALRSRDQHGGADDRAARFRPALPDAVPPAVRGRCAGARGRRVAALRHRAPGIAFCAGHRVLGRGRGVDAADAADGAMGREAVESRRLSSFADFRRRDSIRSSARTISSTGSKSSIGCRRSRPPPTMPVPAARRPGAPRRRSKAPSGSKRFRSTRLATT